MMRSGRAGDETPLSPKIDENLLSPKLQDACGDAEWQA